MTTCRPYFKHQRFRHNTMGGFSPQQLAGYYNFPKGYTGAGKNVAVIELGGGFVQSDLDGYFKSMGLKVKPIIFHSIQSATNTLDGPDGADGEVMLDLCVVGGMAPGVQLHCYTAPNTDAGFLAAINQAITDKMDAISISWGAPEDAWDPTVVQQFDAAFQRAAQANITVTAAAGDNGSGDGEPGQHVDYPAASPWVLGCGGTAVQSMSPITEVVWNDGSQGGATGGGISSRTVIPAWQKIANVPGGKFRGVPDVAGNADPSTGWNIIVDGQQMIIGGTSAVAPMWAALAACLSQALGTNVGFLPAVLYSLKGWSRDILSGNNGTYSARAGYDCCTGLGVPNGQALLQLMLPAAPPAPPPAPPPPAPVPPPAPPTPPPSPPPPAPAVKHTIVVSGSITVDGKVVA